MFPIIVWICGIVLEGLLLARGSKSGNLSRFPMFFSYLTLILAQSIFLYVVARFYAGQYAGLYWTFELLDIFAGCAVVAEVYRIGLAERPGVRKVARNVLLLVFCLTIGRVVVTAQEGLARWTPMMTIQLQRDMRFVQIVAVATLLALILYYAIPLGRNLRGIVLGYGLFLGFAILNLTLMRRFGNQAQTLASYVQSLSYLLVLCLWTTSLWYYHPRPVAEYSAAGSGRSYDELFEETQTRLGKARETVKSALDSE